VSGRHEEQSYGQPEVIVRDCNGLLVAFREATPHGETWRKVIPGLSVE